MKRSTLFSVFLFTSSYILAGNAGAECGDHVWPDCEYCGQDAYWSSSQTYVEMNHDCITNITDFGMFAHDFLSYPQSYFPGGDFTADLRVNLEDFATFAYGYFQHPIVVPCNSCPALPDTCFCTVRLTFSPFDPSLDIDQIELEPEVEEHVGVVVEGCVGLVAYVYAIESSPNVVLGELESEGLTMTGGASATYPPIDGEPHWRGGCNFYVTDMEPAWLRIVPAPGHPPGYQLMWAQYEPPRSCFFQTIQHAGVNGPPPPNSNGCATSGVETATAPSPFLPRVFPSPASDGITLDLGSTASATGSVHVYDTIGRNVRTLADGEILSGTLVWDGRAEGGDRVPPGVYFARVTTRSGSRSVRIIIVR